MFSRASNTLRRGLQRSVNRCTQQQSRSMAHGHYMTVSEQHTQAGEIFGVIAWLWVFHRARHDLPVVLGWRHPWEHAEDPFEPHVHPVAGLAAEDRKEAWDAFASKSLNFGDDDDDDDDDEDDDEDDE